MSGFWAKAFLKMIFHGGNVDFHGQIANKGLGVCHGGGLFHIVTAFDSFYLEIALASV